MSKVLKITLTPTEEADIAGWVNYYIANPSAPVQRIVLDSRTQERVKEITEQFQATPVPIPVPSNPIEAFKARQRVSQNCAWFLLSPPEEGSMKAAMPNRAEEISRYVAFYTPGGSGALGINERLDPTDGYVFVDSNQNWVKDINQAADVEVQRIATSQSRTVPGPFVF